MSTCRQLSIDGGKELTLAMEYGSTYGRRSWLTLRLADSSSGRDYEPINTLRLSFKLTELDFTSRLTSLAAPFGKTSEKDSERKRALAFIKPGIRTVWETSFQLYI